MAEFTMAPPFAASFRLQDTTHFVVRPQQRQANGVQTDETHGERASERQGRGVGNARVRAARGVFEIFPFLGEMLPKRAS